MDVKNACNSFINGLQVAEALILSGQYDTALVAAGELPSRAAKWKLDNFVDLRLSFAGYTFGDAGAAALLRATSNRTGIFYRRFWSASRYWNLGGLLAGGSMHLHGDEYTYFRGDGAALKEAFSDLGSQFVLDALNESGTCYQDYARFFIHQVTMDYLEEFVRSAGIPRDRVIATLPTHGNMAAATLPVGLNLAIQRGEVVRGDKVMLIGLAGGVSLGTIMFEY
jgi:3-oxoacyl-[acyl-carrier-protein] synthase III